MKKWLILIGMLLVIYFFPLKIFSLPDDWTLSFKGEVRKLLTQQEETEKVTPDAVKGIKLGMTKQQVEKKLGKPQDRLVNEYSSYWTIYHDDFKNFMMIDYEKGKVAGLYTKAGAFHSEHGIKDGMSEQVVRQQLGSPLKVVEGPDYRIRLQNNHRLMYQQDGNLTTYYFDQFEDDQLVGIKVVAQSLENKKKRFYANPTKAWLQAQEKLDYYLVNVDRQKYHLPLLTYHDKISKTAYKHSKDMARHHYFNHINQKGQTPFDRMERDHIFYQSAGENLAYGQVNAIEAHHDLMNSKGHRKNILNKTFAELGVGVAVDVQNVPYYTENYILE